MLEICGFCFPRFDLGQANLNDTNLDKMTPADIPDVVRLFSTYYGGELL